MEFTLRARHAGWHFKTKTKALITVEFFFSVLPNTRPEPCLVWNFFLRICMRSREDFTAISLFIFNSITHCEMFKQYMKILYYKGLQTDLILPFKILIGDLRPKPSLYWTFVRFTNGSLVFLLSLPVYGSFANHFVWTIISPKHPNGHKFCLPQYYPWKTTCLKQALNKMDILAMFDLPSVKWAFAELMLCLFYKNFQSFMFFTLYECRPKFILSFCVMALAPSWLPSILDFTVILFG